MLGKLIKYDFRSCIRKFGPLWLGMAALAVINGFTIGHVLDNDHITGWLQFFAGVVPLILLIVLWTAVAIMSLVFICQRFYKGLLGDEGYLMLTLPVTTGEHITSKAIVALLLETITAVVAVASGLLLVTVYKPEILGEIGRHLPEVLSYMNGKVWLILLEYLLFTLVEAVLQTLHIYLAICLGHLAREHRVALSIVAYVLISIAMSHLITLCVPMIERFPEEWFITFDEMGMHFAGFGPIAGLIGAGILVSAIIAAVFFCISNYILRRKLNLE
ncbi:MAG: hypothetical protein IKQ10_04695 [Oscillospiraceae bacterium]|nr:hypothetical protein [Oscillospiraceae bacterium]